MSSNVSVRIRHAFARTWPAMGNDIIWLRLLNPYQLAFSLRWQRRSPTTPAFLLSALQSWWPTTRRSPPHSIARGQLSAIVKPQRSCRVRKSYRPESLPKSSAVSSCTASTRCTSTSSTSPTVPSRSTTRSRSSSASPGFRISTRRRIRSTTTPSSRKTMPTIIHGETISLCSQSFQHSSSACTYECHHYETASFLFLIYFSCDSN